MADFEEDADGIDGSLLVAGLGAATGCEESQVVARILNRAGPGDSRSDLSLTAGEPLGNKAENQARFMLPPWRK